jgi:hypothetical protein
MKPRNGTASTRRRDIVLDPAYRRAVAALESLPENQSGADKTWIERAQRAWRDHYRRAVR